MGWETSTRRSRLPPDWKSRRAKVKARAEGMCEAQVHVTECDGIGTECDHITRGDDHSLSNLQWLSMPCHKAKTATEGKRAVKLPVEPHPAWSNTRSDGGPGVPQGAS